jgi:hypothetical protein
MLIIWFVPWQELVLNFGVCILLCVLDQVQGFPSNATIFQQLFTILFKLSAACFGRRTIFRRKYTNRMYIFPPEDGRTTETCSG